MARDTLLRQLDSFALQVREARPGEVGGQATLHTIRAFTHRHLAELSLAQAQQLAAQLQLAQAQQLAAQVHADRWWMWREEVDLVVEGMTLLGQAWRNPDSPAPPGSAAPVCVGHMPQGPVVVEGRTELALPSCLAAFERSDVTSALTAYKHTQIECAKSTHYFK